MVRQRQEETSGLDSVPFNLLIYSSSPGNFSISLASVVCLAGPLILWRMWLFGAGKTERGPQNDLEHALAAQIGRLTSTNILQEIVRFNMTVQILGMEGLPRKYKQVLSAWRVPMPLIRANASPHRCPCQCLSSMPQSLHAQACVVFADRVTLSYRRALPTCADG